ncbi:RagB/SusD family nutrient uptake outer membrane protein [Draconibacterium mangrovi]|uniref:RagB/SusD family nutrient uptake outer membrane protein n=1 Tax=Draconibacterium mangrovi TaxID=2697469 RepID=UPI0013D1D937|nr:RagB/SusD family nutrient uptake outer membrane protein [Draconibacterium mangrovi]
MKSLRYIFMMLLVVVAITACEDLEVENLNDPDFDTAFSNPNDIKGVTGGLLNRWFQINQEYDGPGLALWTAADAGTCSWGNAGMRDFGNEPRLEFDNKPSYSNAVITEDYYNTLYSILSQSNDVLAQTITNGVTMDDGSTEVTNAMAYFIQGITLGYLGLLYDQAFIITHETDLSVEVPTSPYQDVIAAAINSLDACISICNSSSFTIPAEWLPGEAWTASEFAQLANSFAARFLVYSARNKSEDNSTDWNKVYSYASKGIEKDFAPLADDIVWYSTYQTYSIYGGWGQIDMYVINLMDPDMPAVFPSSGLFTDLPNNGLASSDDARLESDFEYLSSCPFRAERGYYHFSSYRYSRLDKYLETWTEPMPVFYKAENDYLLAEAALRTGSVQEAADIMNASARVTRGGLPELPADAAQIQEAIHYERMVELMLSGMGIQFFEMRKSDLLQSGTLLHFPIPGSQLEVMQMDYYTFGAGTGVAGEDYSNGGWK